MGVIRRSIGTGRAVGGARPDGAGGGSPGAPTNGSPGEGASCGCAVGLLAASARRDPSAIAIEDDGRRRTRARLLDDVARCAQGLHELGVRPGHRVVILVGTRTEAVLAFHAVLRIGAIAVLQDPRATPRELRRALEDHAAIVAVAEREALPTVAALPADLHPKAVVAVEPVTSTSDLLRTAARGAGAPVRVLRALREQGPAARARWAIGRAAREAEDRGARPSPRADRVIRWAALLASSPLPLAHRCPSPRDLAMLQYTVGMDGHPIGAMLTHENLVAGARQMASSRARENGPTGTTGTASAAGARDAMMRPAGSTSVCSTVPLHEPAGAPLFLVAPLLAGHRIVLAATAAQVLAAHRRRRIDVLVAPPAVLSRIAQLAEGTGEAGPDGLPGARRTIAVLGPVPPALTARWTDLAGRPPEVGYVRAECGLALIGRADPAEPRLLGRPVPGVRVRRGEDGTLGVAGRQVFHGYWNRPDETAQVLSGDGWVDLGDVVRTIGDDLVLVRRGRSFLLLADGRCVSPREVAGALLGHPAVLGARTISHPAGEGGEVIEAQVVLRPEAAAEERELLAWAASRLSPAAVPARIHQVPALAAGEGGGGARGRGWLRRVGA